MPVQGRQRRKAIRGGLGVVAQIGQHVRNELALKGVVVHHQHARPERLRGFGQAAHGDRLFGHRHLQFARDLGQGHDGRRGFLEGRANALGGDLAHLLPQHLRCPHVGMVLDPAQGILHRAACVLERMAGAARKVVHALRRGLQGRQGVGDVARPGRDLRVAALVFRATELANAAEDRHHQPMAVDHVRPEQDVIVEVAPFAQGEDFVAIVLVAEQHAAVPAGLDLPARELQAEVGLVGMHERGESQHQNVRAKRVEGLRELVRVPLHVHLVELRGELALQRLHLGLAFADHQQAGVAKNVHGRASSASGVTCVASRTAMPSAMSPRLARVCSSCGSMSTRLARSSAPSHRLAMDSIRL